MASPTSVTRNDSQSSSGRRSTSLGSRLFRSKSGDNLSERKSSGRLRKKSTIDEEGHISPSPPRLPGYVSQPLGLKSFGGENYVPRMSSREYKSADAPPVPPLPGHIEKDLVDPYARTESMTHREHEDLAQIDPITNLNLGGRYSYANSTVSTLNSPRRVSHNKNLMCSPRCLEQFLFTICPARLNLIADVYVGQVRRRKDPTPFNVLIIGARNSGKTSFLNFLKTSLALPPKKQPHRGLDGETPPPSAKQNHNFTHHYQEIEVDSERIGLTLWDSQGLDKSIVDLQLREMSNFVESKFDDTLVEEMKVVRSPGVRDTHIHCVFLILDPSRLDTNIHTAQQNQPDATTNGRLNKASRIIGALDEDFDLQVIKTLQGKTTVVPVISKSDTITTAHMAFLKKKVCESLKRAGLDPLEALTFENGDDDDEDKLDEVDEDAVAAKQDSTSEEDSAPASPISAHTEDSETVPEKTTSNMARQISHKRDASNVSIANSMLESGFIPLSILSPDEYSLDPANGPVGRKFPWGFADPYNSEHCDFVKLKEAVFAEWRSELREASRERFYEAWRTSRLNRQGSGVNGTRNIADFRKSSKAR